MSEEKKNKKLYPQTVRDEFNVFPGRNTIDPDYVSAVLRLTPLANQTRDILFP